MLGVDEDQDEVVDQAPCGAPLVGLLKGIPHEFCLENEKGLFLKRNLEKKGWVYFRLSISDGVDRFRVKVKETLFLCDNGGLLQDGLKRVYIRRDKAYNLDLCHEAVSQRTTPGVHMLYIDNPVPGEWVVGVEYHDDYQGLSEIIYEEDVYEEEVPSWINELFLQADERSKGLVSTYELCEYLLFSFPSINIQKLNASFDCVGDAVHLDRRAFNQWVGQNIDLFTSTSLEIVNPGLSQTGPTLGLPPPPDPAPSGARPGARIAMIIHPRLGIVNPRVLSLATTLAREHKLRPGLERRATELGILPLE